MKNKRLYREGKYKCFLGKDLDECYALGFYSGSISRWEMERRVLQYNPKLRFIKTRDYSVIWDKSKGENGVICGVPVLITVPKHSLMEYNFSKDRKLEYTNMYGETTGSEIINKDEYNYKVLARGWKTIFAIVEKEGFRVDRRGL